MPKKIALCIGINNYPGTGSDLSGCLNDVADWSKVLKANGYTVSTLTDKQATGKQIVSAMQKLIGSAKAGDSVFIQYSGHGSYVPDTNGDEPDGVDECICPYDINSKGPVTDDTLFTLFESKAKGVKLVMASDSCHSGTVARFAPISTPSTTGSSNAPTRKVRFLPPATFLSARQVSALGTRSLMRRSSPPGRYGALLLSGCQDYEYSYDAYFKGRPNGAFTYVALAALSKLKANATYADWHKAIRTVLPSQQYPQSPNFFGSTAMKAWQIFK